MPLDTALSILEAHDQQGRQSYEPGKIEVLSHFTIDGRSGSEWQEIDLTRSALRDWLGY